MNHFSVYDSLWTDQEIIEFCIHSVVHRYAFNEAKENAAQHQHVSVSVQIYIVLTV